MEKFNHTNLKKHANLIRGVTRSEFIITFQKLFGWLCFGGLDQTSGRLMGALLTSGVH